MSGPGRNGPTLRRRAVMIGGAALLAGAVALLLFRNLGDGARRSDFELRSEVPSSGPGFKQALFQTTGVQFTAGNAVEWIDDGAVFGRIADDVAKARRSVNIVLFIWRPGAPGDGMAALLAERGRAGVACRVLVDPTGSPRFEEEVKPRLEEGGCQVQLFRPLPTKENLARNHRKLVIVDAKVGYTGGFGFQDVWLSEGPHAQGWVEASARVEGPVLAQLQQAFAENWQEARGELLPPGDFPAPGPAGGAEAAFVTSTAHPELTISERLVLLLVKSAKRRLWIAQAYFTPTQPLMELLAQKASEGVDVRLLVPGDNNDQKAVTLVQRKTYKTLLPAKVRIFEWPPSMMHAKTFVVDDQVAVVGSINFDPLSYRWLEEGALVVHDRAFNARAAETFERLAAKSVEMREEDHPP